MLRNDSPFASNEAQRLARAWSIEPCNALARFLQNSSEAELDERPLGQWEAMLSTMPAGRGR